MPKSILSSLTPSFPEIPNPRGSPMKEYNKQGYGRANIGMSWWRRWSVTQKIVCVAVTVVLVGIAVGLGVGLTVGRRDHSGFSSSNDTGISSGWEGPGKNTSIWKPERGTTWQIVLLHPLNDTTPDVQVYDIDLFTNNASTISDLHGKNRKVICYFSAGTYESFRPDSTDFSRSDYRNVVEGWNNERWLDTNSANVRRIMVERLDLAAHKGCDGVDPDNVDGYDNDTGFSLNQDDAVNYLTFLANHAHNRSLSIGLKNAGAIVPRVVDLLEWEVNEQCVQYDECDLYRPFVDANKPVFHIEYPDSAPDIDLATANSICGAANTVDFSTLMKALVLDDWYRTCPA
ncbi:hypothetical protein FGG08_005699 [Glutinoglossum americanum]|uniref:alpha-galactosidase n=1 Tax=Glutinoglossum americanum TaxID=1670608 RepID=A0A9P8HU23_9PEZI|nr:hypothetical protein FGG08_005699 [Glutinoglossum americanum]